MSLGGELLKQLKCCLSNDGHILHEPILLKCGANACKKCINESLSGTTKKCFHCNFNHEKVKDDDMTINSIADTLVKSSLSDLFEDLEIKMSNTVEFLTGYFCSN